jgi:hypothetical protein
MKGKRMKKIFKKAKRFSKNQKRFSKIVKNRHGVHFPDSISTKQFPI